MSSQPKSNFVICDKLTGAIQLKVFGYAKDFTLNSNQVIVPVNNENIDQSYYCNDSKSLINKGLFSSGQWVGDEYHIPVPVNTILHWQGETYTINDGTAEVLVDQPGIHSLVLSHPHYQTKVLEIENPNAN